MMARIALDSNLLLLLAVGRAERGLVSRHKRLRAFNDADFELLQGYLVVAEQVVTTPNALTEISNLATFGMREPALSRVKASVAGLIGAIDKSKSLLIIPQCISEVSNLLAQGIHDPLKTRLSDTLKVLIDQCNEHYVSSSSAATAPEYDRLGITDSAWLLALNDQTTLLTDDNNLYLAASARSRDVINFSHLRSESWR